MSPNLLLSLTQEENTKPYIFKTTGIKVFSFEEALFHCFQYWKQSVDDFSCEEFIFWVGNTLKLPATSNRIKEISQIDDITEKLLSFLTVTDYFQNAELSLLKTEIDIWSKRLMWERLKDQGDYLMNQNEPERAYAVYKSALDSFENVELMNNAAIALMKLDRFEEAANLLEKAALLAEGDKKQQLSLHLAEAYILGKKSDEARTLMETIIKTYGESAYVHYLLGELEISLGAAGRSVAFYDSAIAADPQPEYIYRLAEVYSKMRLYDKALDTLNLITNKDKTFLKKQADIFIQSNNAPAAIKCMEKALISDAGSVGIWVRLAMYHRLDYDLQKANSAITKALDLDPLDPRANLENARIKKAQGKIKEYQHVLKKVLNGFKQSYRDVD